MISFLPLQTHTHTHTIYNREKWKNVKARKKHLKFQAFFLLLLLYILIIKYYVIREMKNYTINRECLRGLLFFAAVTSETFFFVVKKKSVQ
jgi:hypothetical protein